MSGQPQDFLTDSPTFSYRRVTVDGLPPREEGTVDVALLDMNHSWPNLGHDSIIQSIREAVDAMRSQLEDASLRIRVISFDIRRALEIPEEDDRYFLYVGTGGPGHLDPRENDGASEGSQGITEDPSWEPRLFKLFDAIRADEAKSLLAICHSFGLVCRWSNIAEVKLRGEEKGGKSSGIVPNVLAPAALNHPWFSRFVGELSDGKTYQALDNRLYDLVPLDLSNVVPIAFEDASFDALTIVELARDEDGMPRLLAMNHHPEIIDRAHLRRVLDEKLDRGEVTQDWYDERAQAFRELTETPAAERAMQATSYYTWIGPLEYQLQRIVRLAAKKSLALK